MDATLLLNKGNCILLIYRILHNKISMSSGVIHINYPQHVFLRVSCENRKYCFAPEAILKKIRNMNCWRLYDSSNLRWHSITSWLSWFWPELFLYVPFNSWLTYKVYQSGVTELCSTEWVFSSLCLCQPICPIYPIPICPH